jgi:prepilin-type processing-associated H-X9-DG protein
MGTTINPNWRAVTNGMFGYDKDQSRLPLKAIKIGDVRDGLSNTLAMSERAAKPATREVKGNTAWGSTYDPAVCRSYVVGNEYAAAVKLTTWSAGSLWSMGHPHWNAFVTVIPPNGPSCSGYNDDNLSFASGIFTASSRHPGGVNVVRGDGSVEFVSQTIDAMGGASGYGVWGALGTRSNNEAVSGL